ncbi:MAG TPA: ImmA/IrrE family metallo-endopeptidase [Candidatus Baltobacteraceae bacterium]|nr:ImmA/IrrE family metallo-endopeptidase [Candidatus Baltobacteraceae bacterium]
MNPFELARRLGIRVELADLGSWGGHAELRSEYDPQGPVIRINARMLDETAPQETARLVAAAIAHELYHHREACGEIPRIADRAQRERAADAFARELLGR